MHRDHGAATVPIDGAKSGPRKNFANGRYSTPERHRETQRDKEAQFLSEKTAPHSAAPRIRIGNSELSIGQILSLCLCSQRGFLRVFVSLWCPISQEQISVATA